MSQPSEPGVRRAFEIAGVIVASALRVWGLQSQSLTMDEIADISSASRSLSSVIHVRDGFPPLYGLLVHGWLAAFPGEANVRWLSVILGVLTVLAMWRFGSWAGGERVGWLAALALAISPFHRWVSQEARAYVLYVLLAVVALWFFFRAMSTNERRDWALYALASAAGVYRALFLRAAATRRRTAAAIRTANVGRVRPRCVGECCVGSRVRPSHRPAARGHGVPGVVRARRPVQHRDGRLRVLQHDRRVRDWPVVARAPLAAIVGLPCASCSRGFSRSAVRCSYWSMQP